MSRKYISARHEVIGPKLQKLYGGIWHDKMRAIAVMRDDEVLGGVTFEQFHGEGSSVQMHVASSSPRWLTVDFLYCIFDFAFNHMKVKRVLGFAPVSKPNVIAFDMKIGFVIHSYIPDFYPEGGCFIMSMTREQCRWLNRKHKPDWMSEAA